MPPIDDAAITTGAVLALHYDTAVAVDIADEGHAAVCSCVKREASLGRGFAF